MTVEQAGDRGTVSSPLHSIVWFASSNIFRQAVNAGATLLRPALLSPEMFGLFSILRLVPTYAHYLHLGARHGMRYLTPLYDSQGEHDRAKRLEASVFTGSLALNMLVAGLLVATLWSDWSREVRIGSAICAATVLLGCVYDHFIAEMKAHRMFKAVGMNNYLSAVVYLVGGVILITTLGFYGALLAEVFVIAVMIAVMVSGGVIRPRRGFDVSLFKAAVSLGAPSLLFDATMLMMRTTDRMVIASSLDYEQLGYYGLGAMVMGYVMHIPGATREVMEADLFYHRNAISSQDAFQKYMAKPMTMIGLCMIFVIGPMVLTLPIIVSVLLPAYTGGVLAAQVLMLGGYFMAIAFPARGILAAYGWQKWGALILLSACALHAGLSMLLIAAGLGIVGVALSAGISFFFAAITLFLFVVFKLPTRPSGWVASTMQVMLPFPLMLGVLYAAISLGAWLSWSPWATLAVQLLVFGLALAAGTLAAACAGIIPLQYIPVRRGRRRKSA